MAHLSLTATQSDNFYIPPGWDPKQGSLKKFVGNKGRNQFERNGVIRLELPFDAWCNACSRALGKGTRFNSTKKNVGMYYSTRLWLFEFSCPSCAADFELKTDPEHSTYICGAALRQKVIPQEGTVVYETDYRIRQAKSEMTNNPIYKLEKSDDDRRGAMATYSQLEQLEALSSQNSKHDADANSFLRKRHRIKRKAAQELEARSNALGIHLLPIEACDTPTEFRRARRFPSSSSQTPQLRLIRRPPTSSLLTTTKTRLIKRRKIES